MKQALMMNECDGSLVGNQTDNAAGSILNITLRFSKMLRRETGEARGFRDGLQKPRASHGALLECIIARSDKSCRYSRQAKQGAGDYVCMGRGAS